MSAGRAQGTRGDPGSGGTATRRGVDGCVHQRGLADIALIGTGPGAPSSGVNGRTVAAQGLVSGGRVVWGFSAQHTRPRRVPLASGRAALQLIIRVGEGSAAGPGQADGRVPGRPAALGDRTRDAGPGRRGDVGAVLQQSGAAEGCPSILQTCPLAGPLAGPFGRAFWQARQQQPAGPARREWRDEDPARRASSVETRCTHPGGDRRALGTWPPSRTFTAGLGLRSPSADRRRPLDVLGRGGGGPTRVWLSFQRLLFPRSPRSSVADRRAALANAGSSPIRRVPVRSRRQRTERGDWRRLAAAVSVTHAAGPTTASSPSTRLTAARAVSPAGQTLASPRLPARSWAVTCRRRREGS
ncbi:hypothetical protein P154DRAFT_572172 [Amniculicola lignicola CBS 123094]|uniref:Uncharacterized protein n=1 Tax=Amniculicola lignicola CBS 123094 TaxID=1392246 RepID=A0A6A5WS43_9PLEO|nr:hypothetical protein P154DRAFT_572172 [Amniculicola lignicola CBS 123094]